MTWESGPCDHPVTLPPGYVVISPEQAAAMRDALAALAAALEGWRVAWATVAPQVADAMSAALPTLDEVHLRVLPSLRDRGGERS